MAEGFVLSISPTMLKRLDEADAKISKLQTTSDKTSAKIIDDFRRMATGVDPFINKLKEAQSLLSKMSAPNISIKGFKQTSTDGEKAAKATANITESLNKIKSNPIDDINKKIASLKDLLNQATRSVEEYNRKMASIKSTGSGVISRTTIKEGGAGAALIPQIQAQIAALEQEKKSISSSQILWQQRLDSLNNSSLATQRQVSDLAKLNESFRTGQSELQKQAKAQDDLAKAADKTAKATDKQAAAEAKRNAQAQKKSDTSAERALEKYNNALNKSEVTIANRARKIEALANAERALTKTGRDYTLELTKIRTETERLNKANVDAANTTNKLKSNQRGLVDTAGQLKRQLALAFSVSQITGYVNKMIAIRGEFELQQISLQAILQNKDEADRLFGQITELAVKSPFRVKDLVTYTKQLAAYRIESYKLYDTTKMLADVSAGLGVDMQRIILAFGQVKAANYLRGTELRQFSEAGINILGELSTYFTELEGKMVSVGDVFERVSKRMVSFGDVEEIFKRITSAGGIFYNMQEIQAETLQGQISNLADSMDLMFNDIGKANDGVLKGVVGAIRSIIENWEVLSIMLKATSVGFAVYIAKVIAATAVNKGFTASQIEATISSGGLTKALAKTLLVFRSIGSFMKANPYVLLATAIAAVGYSLYDNEKKVEATKKKYDILNGSLDNSSNKLNKLVEVINRQSDIIEKTSESLGKAKKGTEEYNKAQDQNNEAQKKHGTLLKQLKKEYPEVYSQIVNQKNSTEALTKAQKSYNEQLEKTKLLNYQMRQKEPLFGSGFVETIDDRIESFDEERKASDKMKLAYEDLSIELSFYLKTNRFVSKNTKKEVQDILNSSAKIEDKVPSLRKALSSLRGVGDALPSDFRKQFLELEKTASAYRDANKEVSNSATEMSSWIDTLIDTSLKNIGKTREEFSKLDDESKRGFVKTIQDFLLSQTENKRLLFFSKNIIKQKLGIEIDIDKKNIKSDFSDVQKELQKGIDKIKKDTKASIKDISIDERVEDYADYLYKQATDFEESAKRAERATKALSSTESNEKLAETYRAQAKAMKELAIEYGASSKKDLNEEETEYEKRLKSQLELLKKIQSQYEKLKKYQSEEDVAKNLQESFGDVFEKTFSKPITSIKFDKASIAKEAEEIGKTIGGKSAISLSKSFNEYASLLRSDMVVGVSLERTEQVKSELEDLFSGYELSLELEKLNIPPELAKQLFNVDVFNLDELQKKAAPYLAELRAQGGNQVKVADDIEKKISDMNEKALIDRMKTYSKYLLKSTSESAKIKINELRQIQEIEKTFTKPEQQERKKVVIEAVREESKKELQKQEWSDFKGTDMYTMMFEDLEFMGTKAITRLRENLEQLKGSLSELPVEQVKEIMTQISKLEEQEIKRNPFDALKKSMEDVKALQKEGRTEEYIAEELAISEAQIASSNAQITAIDTIIEARSNNLSLEQQSAEWTAENTQLLKMSNDELNNQRTILLENAEQSEKAATASKIDLSKYSKARKSLQAMGDEWSQLQSMASSAYESIKDILSSMGVESDSTAMVLADMGMSLLDLVGQAVMFGIQMKLLTIQSELLGAAMNTAMGPIGWIVMALQAVATLFSAIFGSKDKSRQKEIEREKDKVEKLERAYEKLEKAIKGALSIDELKKSTIDAGKNIDAQIASYRSMISAEEAKKKTDSGQIKEWQNTIRDLQEQRDQLQVEMTKALGGFGGDKEAMRDAAQDFTDAWYDAYKETGDGLEGLNEQFGEFIDNVVKKQIMLRGVGKMLEPLFKMVDKMFESTSEGAEAVTKGELDKIKEYSDTLLPQLDQFMKDLMGSLGMTGGSSESEMSGLQRGIQGITAEQSDQLASLLNSTRFFVADSNTQIKNIYALFANADAPNPILSELKAQTMLVRSIYDLFNGMTAPHVLKGGRGLKVVLD